MAKNSGKFQRERNFQVKKLGEKSERRIFDHEICFFGLQKELRPKLLLFWRLNTSAIVDYHLLLFKYPKKDKLLRY